MSRQTEMMDVEQFLVRIRVESRYWDFLYDDNIEEIGSYPILFFQSFRSINSSKRKVLKRKEKKKKRIFRRVATVWGAGFVLPIPGWWEAEYRFFHGAGPRSRVQTGTSGLLWSTRIYALTRFTVRWIARENGWGNKTKQNGIRVGERNAPSHV